jgi:hypothetical protein
MNHHLHSEYSRLRDQELARAAATHHRVERASSDGAESKPRFARSIRRRALPQLKRA